MSQVYGLAVCACKGSDGNAQRHFRETPTKSGNQTRAEGTVRDAMLLIVSIVLLAQRIHGLRSREPLDAQVVVLLRQRRKAFDVTRVSRHL